MPRYRKRPIEVEAEQFVGKPISGVHLSEHGGYYVETIQGRKVMVSPGEWVIQEGDGVHAYPCDPVVFERIYEPVSRDPPMNHMLWLELEQERQTNKEDKP